MPPRNKERRARVPLSTDIGSYLRTIRRAKGITLEKVADDLGLSPSTLTSVERNRRKPPTAERLRLWMLALGESKRYSEALTLLRRFKSKREIQYEKRHPANEHIDRLIDAYENYTITDADIELLKMLCPSEYQNPEHRNRQPKTPQKKSRPPQR